MKEFKVICPLIHFQVQSGLRTRARLSKEEIMHLLGEREKDMVKGIELFDKVKLRRISKGDLEDLDDPMLAHLRKVLPFSPRMFVLEKHISVENEHNFEADQMMRNVILALRLLKGGYVSGSYVLYILLSKKRRLDGWSREEEPRPSDPFIYVLGFDEIPTVKKILKKIQGIDFTKRKSLHLAFKRFQRAYEEEDIEDRLIDFMIAFEALFLRGEKAMRPAGRIVAIACSILLGKNDEEREEIRRLLTKAYSIRNCIVHGAEYQKTHFKGEFEMFNFVPKIEDYLRESIKKLLE